MSCEAGFGADGMTIRKVKKSINNRTIRRSLRAMVLGLGMSLMASGPIGCAIVDAPKRTSQGQIEKKEGLTARILRECDEGQTRYVYPVVQSLDKVRIKGHIRREGDITPTTALVADDLPSDVEKIRKIVVVDNVIGVCPLKTGTRMTRKIPIINGHD